MITELGLQIVTGREHNYTYEHKFGSNPTLVSGSQSIWTKGGLYPWSAWDTAGIVSVVSTSASDTSTLEICGLDANWDQVVEIITLNGTTPVVTTGVWKRIHSMKYNHSASNVGIIEATIAGQVVAHIPAAKGQTLMAIYTVPRLYKCYGLQITYGIGKGGDARFDLMVRNNFESTGFRIYGETNLYQSSFTQTYAMPVEIPQMADVDILAITGGNNFPASVSFDLLLRKHT